MCKRYPFSIKAVRILPLKPVVFMVKPYFKGLVSVLLVLLLLCGSCGRLGKDKAAVSDDSLLGSWRLSDIAGNDSIKKYSEDRLLQAAQDKKQVGEGTVLSFFGDGTFTEISGDGRYKWGEWRLSGNELAFRPSGGGAPENMPLTQEKLNGRPTLNLQDGAAKHELTFIQYGRPLKDYRADPFYYSNNTWRIRPAQPETREQLQERLANYFRHLAYILQSSKDREQDIVSFEFSPGLVKIYNGGIGINPLESVARPWIATFYNEADAAKAHHMFQRYLATSSYKGAGTGDWITDDYNILLSIYGDVKEGKFPED